MSPGKQDRLRERMNRPRPVDPDAPDGPPQAPPPPVAAVPDPEPEPAAAPEPGPPAELEPSRRPAPRRATRRRGTAPAAAVVNALEDPECVPGRKYYRSFYVSDEPYFRFRAAIHWASRNPDAADEVPENMTAAVEDFMLEIAADLEQRFNGGEVFRMPPPTKRRGGTKGKPGP